MSRDSVRVPVLQAPALPAATASASSAVGASPRACPRAARRRGPIRRLLHALRRACAVRPTPMEIDVDGRRGRHRPRPRASRNEDALYLDARPGRRSSATASRRRRAAADAASRGRRGGRRVRSRPRCATTASVDATAHGGRDCAAAQAPSRSCPPHDLDAPCCTIVAPPSRPRPGRAGSATAARTGWPGEPAHATTRGRRAGRDGSSPPRRTPTRARTRSPLAGRATPRDVPPHRRCRSRPARDGSCCAPTASGTTCPQPHAARARAPALTRARSTAAGAMVRPRARRGRSRQHHRPRHRHPHHPGGPRMTVHRRDLPERVPARGRRRGQRDRHRHRGRRSPDGRHGVRTRAPPRSSSSTARVDGLPGDQDAPPRGRRRPRSTRCATASRSR